MNPYLLFPVTFVLVALVLLALYFAIKSTREMFSKPWDKEVVKHGVNDLADRSPRPPDPPPQVARPLKEVIQIKANLSLDGVEIRMDGCNEGRTTPDGARWLAKCLLDAAAAIDGIAAPPEPETRPAVDDFGSLGAPPSCVNPANQHHCALCGAEWPGGTTPESAPPRGR